MSSGGEEGGFIFAYEAKEEMARTFDAAVAAFDAFHGRSERS
jgi:hypothetical protein